MNFNINESAGLIRPSARMALIKKSSLLFLCILYLSMFLSACSGQSSAPDKDSFITNQPSPTGGVSSDLSDSESGSDPIPTLAPTPVSEPYSFINPEGTSLLSRINPPEGYTRISSAPGELTPFLRDFPLKPDQSPVLLYDGSKKSNQSIHSAVFDLEIGDRDLQQCADSVIRMYGEYYWSEQQYDKIAFHLTNGFLMEYTKWREGNRLLVNRNKVSWNKSKGYDDSYESFRQYLTMVFAYAGTLSLSEESNPIELSEIRPGDMFLQGGSPGHCVMVVDIATDDMGNRCFLLAQGYMPAQDFHIIKNPLHEQDPWYYTEEIQYPFHTPSWTFDSGSLVRWADFPLEGTPGESADSAKTQLTLLATGDNLIHIEVIQSGKQADGTYNYDHLYSNLAQTIAAADVAVINQETILGGEHFRYSGYPNFNSPTEIGDAVINSGFDVALQATNHTLDMGVKGVERTFEYWEQHPEILVLGINRDQEEQNKIPLLEKNGITLAMLNYTYGLNGYKLPADQPYLVNLLNKEQMKRDILKAKELADFVIVFPHWGAEYVYEPNSSQKNLTEFFYSLGVDLVIGAHPHVLQPVEWIETSPGHKMLVYYSLGNFISYQREAPRMLGGLAEITITKDESGTYISDAGITPIVTHYEIGPSDYNYDIFRLQDYTPELAQIHGVNQIAVQGPFTYENTLALARQVLGTWFPE